MYLATPLPHAETLELIRRAQAGDRRARDRAVLTKMRLVHRIAQGLRERGLGLDELMQEGAIGLLTAIARFDLKRELRFSTYATWWVRHRIQRAVEDTGRTVRLPVQRQAKLFEGVIEPDGVALERQGWSLDAPMGERYRDLLRHDVGHVPARG